MTQVCVCVVGRGATFCCWCLTFPPHQKTLLLLSPSLQRVALYFCCCFSHSTTLQDLEFCLPPVFLLLMLLMLLNVNDNGDFLLLLKLCVLLPVPSRALPLQQKLASFSILHFPIHPLLLLLLLPFPPLQLLLFSSFPLSGYPPTITFLTFCLLHKTFLTQLGEIAKANRSETRLLFDLIS